MELYSTQIVTGQYVSNSHYQLTNRTWLSKNENSNICFCNWMIANFILTTNLCIVVLSHKDNQVVCGKSSWYRLSRLFEYYFITIIAIVITTIIIFPLHSSHYPWILFSSFVDSISMSTEYQPTTDHLPTDQPTHRPTDTIIMFKRLEYSKIFILQNTNSWGNVKRYFSLLSRKSLIFPDIEISIRPDAFFSL